MSNLLSRILQRSINDEDLVNQTMPSAQSDTDEGLIHESRALEYCFEALGERLIRGNVLHLGNMLPGTLSFLQDYCVHLTVADLPQTMDADSIESDLAILNANRQFDLVLLWDAINYLEIEAVPALISFLDKSLKPEGMLFFSVHNRTPYPDSASLYEITSSNQLSRSNTTALTRTILFNSADFLKKCSPGFDSRSFQLRSGMQEIVLTRHS